MGDMADLYDWGVEEDFYDDDFDDYDDDFDDYDALDVVWERVRRPDTTTNGAQFGGGR